MTTQKTKLFWRKTRSSLPTRWALNCLRLVLRKTSTSRRLVEIHLLHVVSKFQVGVVDSAFLGDLLCFYVCLLYFLCYLCTVCVPSVLWYCWLGLLTCKNRLPYNLYCVGGDVKPINQLWVFNLLDAGSHKLLSTLYFCVTCYLFVLLSYFGSSINQSVTFLTWPKQQTAPQNNRLAIRMEVFGEWLAAFIRQYRVQRGWIPAEPCLCSTHMPFIMFLLQRLLSAPGLAV